MKLKYTYPTGFVGFSVYRCGLSSVGLLAWDSTTSSSGGIVSTVWVTALPTSSPTTALTDSTVPATTPEPKSDEPRGYSQSDKIALGCGIGIGLPAAIAAIVTCLRRRG